MIMPESKSGFRFAVARQNFCQNGHLEHFLEFLILEPEHAIIFDYTRRIEDGSKNFKILSSRKNLGQKF
jgi:hypothetical protein